MNPTTRPQPPELSLSTAYLWVSTTGKNWRLDWGPPGRRRPPHRSREGVSEAVATRQAKSDPRPLVPAHRGTKGRQADGTARARIARDQRSLGPCERRSREQTQGNLRLGASPPSLRDERDARCKLIPRPNGRPQNAKRSDGLHESSALVNAEHATPLAGPTYRARTRYRLAGPRSAGEKLPAGTRDWPAVPRWNPRASARGGCQSSPSAPRSQTFETGSPAGGVWSISPRVRVSFIVSRWESLSVPNSFARLRSRGYRSRRSTAAANDRCTVWNGTGSGRRSEPPGGSTGRVSRGLPPRYFTLILTDKRMYTRRTRITPFDGANGESLVSRFHLISSTSMNRPGDSYPTEAYRREWQIAPSRTPSGSYSSSG